MSTPPLSEGTIGGDLLRVGMPFWDRAERDQAAERLCNEAGALRQDEFERARSNLSASQIDSLRVAGVWNTAAELGTIPCELAEVSRERLRARIANHVQEVAAGPAWERSRPERKRGDRYRVREVSLDQTLADRSLLWAIELTENQSEARYELDGLLTVASQQERAILTAALDQVSRDDELNKAQVAEDLGLSRQRVRGALDRLRRKAAG